ncbi:MAG: 2-hydroxychromene-2-carboxylate isomerase [Pseudomonadales bacterium]
MQVEYFFDCSSPWTYLSYTWIESLCRETGAELVWKPFLVGGVFNTVNSSVYEQRANPVPAKAAYYQKDLQDWARYQGIEIGKPPIFPVNSVKAMRGCFVAEAAGCISDYAGNIFRAYWTNLQDISQDDVLREIVRATGLDEDAFFTEIASQACKDKLRANTDELIARGGFGSPTIFIDKTDIYFGNDRLPLIEYKLRGEGPDSSGKFW